MSNIFYTNFDVDWDNILISGYKDGVKFNIKEKVKPYLFISSAVETQYKSFDGKDVARIDFDSIGEARKFIKSYQYNQEIKVYGLPMFQYVYMYDHFKNNVPDTSLIKILNFDIETDNSNGYPDSNLADKQINVITLKLFGSKECYTLALGNWDGGEHEVEIQKLRDAGYHLNFKSFEQEKDLLKEFVKIWKNLKPDVITGWNIDGFDVQYIIKRLKYNFGDKYPYKLSPFGKIKSGKVEVYNKQIDSYNIVGIPSLDYMKIYKKFTPGREESYSLNYLSGKLINATKLDYSEYGTLSDLQKKDFAKYISYNIIDVIRVEQIDQTINYMSIAFEIAYESKTTFTDCFGTIRVWDVMIHNYLMDRNTVVPLYTGKMKSQSIEGGYVKQPIIGKHKWVMSFDFKSLYPHLCMSFNLSPETFVGMFERIKDDPVKYFLENKILAIHDKLVEKNVCIAGNGAIYKRDKQGFIPAIMENLFAKRASHSAEEEHYTKLLEKIREVKLKRGLTEKLTGSVSIDDQTNFDDLTDKEILQLERKYTIKETQCARNSWAIKILLNGGYGAITNDSNRFFSNDIAESFTLSGRMSTKTVERYVNKKLNGILNTDGQDYIIACDTDSIYVKLDTLVERFKGKDQDPVDFLEEYSDTIQQWIKEALETIYYQTNIFQKKLRMSLESIGSAIWTAKKKYMMSLPSYKKVRYNPPKIKIQGIEAVRSSTPRIIREWIKKAIPIALSDNDQALKKFVDDKWGEYINLGFNDISMPKGTNDIEAYYDKTNIYKDATPMHIRGCLLYNHYLEQNNLTDHIEKIKSGDKIKVMYLKLPNPIMENAISTPEELPGELNVFEKYIDYEKQFEVSFLNPIKRITEAADINISDQINIEQFFKVG